MGPCWRGVPLERGGGRQRVAERGRPDPVAAICDCRAAQHLHLRCSCSRATAPARPATVRILSLWSSRINPLPTSHGALHTSKFCVPFGRWHVLKPSPPDSHNHHEGQSTLFGKVVGQERCTEHVPAASAWHVGNRSQRVATTCSTALRGHRERLPNGTPNEAWLDLDLADTLAALADAGHGAAVLQLLEAPRRECPELLVSALAGARGEYGVLQQEVRSGSRHASAAAKQDHKRRCHNPRQLVPD